MIRTFKVLFCDNEHGTGDQMFPANFSQELQDDMLQSRTAAQLRKDAKKAGWSRSGGVDYCDSCTESNKEEVNG
jgi:hypothetical protein